MRLPSRCAASRWRSSASSIVRRRSCGVLRAPSVQKERGPRAVYRRRGADRLRLARPRLAKSARRGAGDARSARRPGECRACAAPRGALLCGASTRPSGYSPRSIPRSPSALEGRHGADRWNRDAAPPDEEGTRCPRARRRRRVRHVRIPALMAEVVKRGARAGRARTRPTPRVRSAPFLPEEVEALQASKALVVDACRHVVRDAGNGSLATRPVLFAIARALGEGVARWSPLRGFRVKMADELHRARLRVEVGRLRTTSLRALAAVSATKRGFTLAPRRAARSRGAWTAG